MYEFCAGSQNRTGYAFLFQGYLDYIISDNASESGTSRPAKAGRYSLAR